jgi:hypothetical protein
MALSHDNTGSKIYLKPYLENLGDKIKRKAKSIIYARMGKGALEIW